MAGFDCDFVEKPPRTFPQSECSICLLVLREPYQATCCGKSFCKGCIERIKARTHVCPTCKAENFFSYPNKGLQQSLYDFQVYCSHRSKGCEWTGELRELDNHLNSDPPADKSLEGCPFTVINCPLSHTGCEVRLSRKDVKAHVNDNLVSHLIKQTSLMQRIIQEKEQLQQHVADLEGELKELKQEVDTGQPIGPVELTMTNFQQRYRDHDVWFSPPFYSHPHGYKMCLRVYANGEGNCEGTHVSVFVSLMRGVFDDCLKWPFRGNITIQLLNQEEDKDHVVEIADFTDHTPDKYSKRVSKGEQSLFGWGYPNFLPHTDLEPKYLKNDCLKFRISKILLIQQ